MCRRAPDGGVVDRKRDRLSARRAGTRLLVVTRQADPGRGSSCCQDRTDQRPLPRARTRTVDARRSDGSAISTSSSFPSVSQRRNRGQVSVVHPRPAGIRAGQNPAEAPSDDT